MAFYTLTIEMRPQHLEDVAVWLYIQTKGAGSPALHDFPEQILEAIKESKAIKPDKWEALVKFVESEIEKAYTPKKYLNNEES